MKNIKVIFLCFWTSFAMHACVEENPFSGADGEKTEIKISGNIEQRYSTATRVSDSGFADGDAIGLYIVNYAQGNPGNLLPQGNHVTNMKHTFDASKNTWTGTSTIYWKDDETPVDAYSYYPFREWVENPQSLMVDIAMRQDTKEDGDLLSGYEKSDFLWSKATKVTSDNTIQLNHQHLMAGIEVNLIPGTGFTAEEWKTFEKSVLVHGMASKASVNLSSGEVAASGNELISVVPMQRTDGVFRAVVVPKSIPAGQKLLSITVDGNAYEFKRKAETVLSGRRLHTFTIEVIQRLPEGDFEFNLIDESVKAWEDDGLSHNGTIREYVIVKSPRKGGLEEALKASDIDLKLLENLKVTGEMNGYDFLFIRNNLPALEALNLYDVKLRDGTFNFNMWDSNWVPGNDDPLEDDVMPDYAFYTCRQLKYITFPKELKKIGAFAFRASGLSGALIIPEGVTHIGNSAFNNWSDYEGAHMYLTSLSLPSTLEFIGETAFKEQKFNCELILPESVTEIGNEAFSKCHYLYGQFHLPSSLKVLGDGAFGGLSKLTGPMIMPADIKRVSGLGQTGCSSLVLNEGLEEIGNHAFGASGLGGNSFKGELYVPKTVKQLGDEAFWGSQFSHVYLPEGITELPINLFGNCDKLIDTLYVPSTVKQIRSGVFNGCSRLSAIVLPKGLQSIGGNNGPGLQVPVFGGCYALNILRCNATTPPLIIGDAFGDLPKNNFTIEVPAGSVEAYRNAEGWKEFKRIAPYSGFVCRPQFGNLLNKGSKRDIVLNADGAWRVKQKPAWCRLSAESGFKKTQLTITIDDLPDGAATRKDSIVFALDEKDYTCCYYINQYNSEYKEDGCYALQKAKRGKGINIILLGDGYDAKDIAGGVCINAMRETMEHFFGVEPFATYRDYFNVYTIWALSYESGIGTLNTLRDTKFKTEYGNFTYDSRIHCEADYTMSYAVEHSPVTADNLKDALVVLVPNSNVYDGVTYMYGNGAALAICPKSDLPFPNDARGLVQHEAGGHGFGKLTDEYIYHRAWIQTCKCTCCEHLNDLHYEHNLGWGMNVWDKGRYDEVPWKHLIYDKRFNDIVDIYDGGFFHSNGVYRSESNSVMNNNIPYFSTWSRELIVRRIKSLAGEPFDFEEFVSKDSREWGRDFTNPGVSSRSMMENAAAPALHGAAPVIINRSPNLHIRKK